MTEEFSFYLIVIYDKTGETLQKRNEVLNRWKKCQEMYAATDIGYRSAIDNIIPGRDLEPLFDKVRGIRQEIHLIRKGNAQGMTIYQLN